MNVDNAAAIAAAELEAWERSSVPRCALTREAAVRTIADPIVVAELRRLIHDDHPGTIGEAARDRIAELEQW